MLSYRHSYHAGNFADVLKHICLLESLNYLIRKDKPFCYLDTHSGCSAYSLRSEQSQKTQEYQGGIGTLWSADNLPESVAAYVQQVKGYNDTPELLRYPGSPWFAQQVLRRDDRLFLCELHSKEVELLRANMRGDRRVQVRNEDGFSAMISLMPPKERRGLVLIDPSYEIKDDYQKVVQALVNAHRRFATGIYAIWYPVVQRQRIHEMEQALKKTGIRNIQLFELGVLPDEEKGMTSSGMIVVNPPWPLKQTMEQTLPWLAQTLGIDGQGFYRIEELVGE